MVHKLVKIVIMSLSIIGGLSMIVPGNDSFAATYYVAPHGNDNSPGTCALPWATFVRAMLALKRGDSLYLEDGVYDQSLDVMVSGSRGNVIKIAAVNDGRAIVDGQWVRRALVVHNHSYIEVDGINFRNSGGGTNAHGIDIGGADHITLRRVTANGSSGYNSAVIDMAGATNSLLEDCAASGQGRIVLNMLGCRDITVRRCWLNWTGPNTGGGDTNSVAQIYDSSYVLMENNIAVNLTNSPTDDIGIWAHYENVKHNTLKGNIVYHTAAYSAGGLRDNAEYGKKSSFGRFENNVSIVPVRGFYHSVPADVIGTDHHISENNTYVGDGGGTGFLVHERPSRPDQVTDASVINSSFLSIWAGIYASSNGENTVSAHRFNNFYNVETCLWNMKPMTPPGLDPTEKCNTGNPGYDIATYGKGAYLMVPAALKGKGEGGADIGANVLYSYEDGVLTARPLWPWPMEDRIKTEFGVSPTWEADGGIWKTLKGVYSPKIHWQKKS